jgi:hypothetical protein
MAEQPNARAMDEGDAGLGGRKRIWMRIRGRGILLALQLSAKPAGADGINISVVNHSLAHDPLFNRPPLITDLVYLAATVVPPESLENRAPNLFGVAAFISFVHAIVQASRRLVFGLALVRNGFQRHHLLCHSRR